MRTPIVGTLALPGGALYYEVRGSGPLLLIIPSGNGDATPFTVMADELAAEYTVVTYDRRGYSRSPVHGDLAEGHRLRIDAHDAHRLLEHLSAEPAHVFGSSSGAIIALALLQWHPQRVRTLIAHEPPLASMLPDAQEWLEWYAELYETYRARGVEAAREVFLARMGMQATRPPKGAELPPDQLAAMLARIKRNHASWFEHEIRNYPGWQPDIQALKSLSDRLLLANGTTSEGTFPYKPNLHLAAQIGVDIAPMPGGHVGYVTHPFEFAAALGELLGARG